MYELFILGQLMDHPMTGYQLRKALISVVGQELTISFGALYPLMDKLAEAKEISLDFKDTDSNRPQKIASITELGKSRFEELVLADVPLNKQTQLTFQMKVHFLHLLTVPEQRKVLTDFQNFTSGQLERLAKIRDHVAHNKNMVPADIADALRVNQLQKLRAQVQLDWINEIIIEINQGDEE